MTSMHRARGFTDNSIVIWILLILALVAAVPVLKRFGIEPGELWGHVPAVWKALLAVTGVMIVAGILILIIANRAEDRLEPYRVEAQGERRLILETKLVEPAVGAIVLVAGLVFLGFGFAGPGWFSWVLLALGLLLALGGLPFATSRRRYVVERGRIAAEHGMLGSWSPTWSRAREPGSRPQLEIKEGAISGGWGSYEVVPDAVTVDGEIVGGPQHAARDARKLLPLLQQAINDTHAGMA
jgi:hypothetical protein